MPYELIPMTCAAGAAIIFAMWGIRSGASTRAALGACLMFFAALTVVGSMIVHSGEILLNQIQGINPGMYQRPEGAPVAQVLGFTYDFRFYSLQMFGGALMWMGVRVARAAVAVMQGSPEGSPQGLKSILCVVLFVTPLLPMSIFAVATTVLMGIAGVGLLVARGRAVTAAEPVLVAIRAR